MKSLSWTFTLAILLTLCARSRADVVYLANGDRYIGSVELVNATEVHVKSEVVGALKIPRAKVASIHFGSDHAVTGPLAPAAAIQPDPILGKGGLDPKAIEQVQKEFLGTATPEANALFNDLVQGLSTGALSVDDLRKQARDSLTELRALQAEIGEEDDNPLLASYVSILEKFINQGQPKTNRAKPAPPKTAPQPKPALEPD